MNTLEARFRIITPMFLGGADQKAVALRPASVKGALRFWWRALYWSHWLKQAKNDEVEALQQLHAEEARLFGIAATKEGGGQGIFLLQVAAPNIQTRDQVFAPMGPGQLYLLGQGLATFKDGNHCLRNAIQRNGEFTLKLIFKPKATPDSVSQISNALLLFGLLGGLGSRARHGLGSVAITAWSGSEPIPQTVTDYKALLQTLLKSSNSATEPPFTAFSQKSRIDVSSQDKDALNLLNSVGIEQQMYRSYGQNGKVNGKPSERNFSADHDLLLAATNGKRIEKAPQRIVFGLPHNYFFSSTKYKADVNYAPDGKDGRRASPLLFHIHPIAGQFMAVHTLLPAKFLPDKAQIRIKAGSTFPVKAAPDWQILRRFMNRFANKEVIYGNE